MEAPLFAVEEVDDELLLPESPLAEPLLLLSDDELDELDEPESDDELEDPAEESDELVAGSFFATVLDDFASDRESFR